MYKFTLESLLQHRKNVEDALQKELADTVRELEDAGRKLRIQLEMQAGLSAELTGKQLKGILISENNLYADRLSQISKMVDGQRKTILQIEEEVDRKRLDLIEAVKKRKSLEKLKEKRWIQYREKLGKAEKCILDDISMRLCNKPG